MEHHAGHSRLDGTSSRLNLPGRRAARTIKLTEANAI
jgi:hypothetical protein